MSLRGKRPEQKDMRLKGFVYGPPGAGKTIAALQFPNAYIIDTAKETDSYYKLIQEKNSEVFECSNIYEVIKELQVLKNEPHRFQTLILDEVTTLYSNIQISWADRFNAAIIEKAEKRKKEIDKADLLEDFGYRFWDKVKRDWKRMLELLKELDMNVIIIAHQKDKYGDGQKVIGITSASDKDDEYFFDFVFRLVKRGKEYKAICEKQRILPQEIAPEEKRFPDEFKWHYENLIKFYNKRYLEDPTKNSQMKLGIEETGEPEIKKDGPEKAQQAVDNFVNKKKEEFKQEEQKKEEQKEEKKIDDKTKKSDYPIDTLENKIKKIKELLKSHNIQIKDFKLFLNNTVQWKHINVLTKLSDKEATIILKNWDEKIYPKYKEIFGIQFEEVNSEETSKQEKQKITTKEEKGEFKEQKFEPDKPIRNDQIETIQKILDENEVSKEKFFKGFDLKGWEEITQEGAENMIQSMDVMIGAFK